MLATARRCAPVASCSRSAPTIDACRRTARRVQRPGLYYAATHIEALHASGEDVVVVGGGNSAGQAVVSLAAYARRIRLVVRRSLTATMSRYLIDRIEAAENVEICEGCEVRLCTVATRSKRSRSPAKTASVDCPPLPCSR